MRFKIEPGFVLLITILVYLDQGGLLWVVLISAFIHEAGHFFVLRALGGRVGEIVFGFGGICIGVVLACAGSAFGTAKCGIMRNSDLGQGYLYLAMGQKYIIIRRKERKWQNGFICSKKVVRR